MPFEKLILVYLDITHRSPRSVYSKKSPVCIWSGPRIPNSSWRNDTNLLNDRSCFILLRWNVIRQSYIILFFPNINWKLMFVHCHEFTSRWFLSFWSQIILLLLFQKISMGRGSCASNCNLKLSWIVVFSILGSLLIFFFHFCLKSFCVIVEMFATQ